MSSHFSEAIVSEVWTHRVGNKTLEESYFLAEKRVKLNDNLQILLKQYFLTPFVSEEYYHFYHDTAIALNECFSYISQIFDKPENMGEWSQNLAKHLYNQSTHPKVKGGDFYVVFFNDCYLHGERMDVVGLFKSENKETFLDVEQIEEGYQITPQEGVNMHKLDKGCLIFNSEKENGFVVSVIDTTNRGSDAQYWVDDFLGLEVTSNDFHQTNQFLSIAKNYVTKQLKNEFDVSKADQIDLLNKSVAYFKNNQSFEQSGFEEAVFGDEKVIDSFRSFDDDYRQKHEIELPKEFDISAQAVKKQARVFKSVLKLDKNFHIYIHGDRDLIEQGVDEHGKKYYKIYYDIEQ